MEDTLDSSVGIDVVTVVSDGMAAIFRRPETQSGREVVDAICWTVSLLLSDVREQLR